MVGPQADNQRFWRLRWRVGRAGVRIEQMFERFSDAALIDAMGEATRDESAMIAQRLAAVGELDAQRTRELADRKLWRHDPFEEVAAEISAAQNISRGRARGQITMARILRDELHQPYEPPPF